MKRIVYYIIFLISLCTLTSCFKKEIYGLQEGIYEFDKEEYRKAIELEEMEEFIEGYEVETFSMIFKKITKEEFIEKEEKYDVLEDLRNREYYSVKFIIKFKDLNEEIYTSFMLANRSEPNAPRGIILNLNSTQLGEKSFGMGFFLKGNSAIDDPRVTEIWLYSSENRNELRRRFFISLYYIDEKTIENEGE